MASRAESGSRRTGALTADMVRYRSRRSAGGCRVMPGCGWSGKPHRLPVPDWPGRAGLGVAAEEAEQSLLG